jgi:hypothetical protein
VSRGELLEQRLGFLQDRRVEPFGEPSVDRREEIARFGVFALVAPQTGEADGGAQLPQPRTLLLGQGQSLNHRSPVLWARANASSKSDSASDIQSVRMHAVAIRPR